MKLKISGDKAIHRKVIATIIGGLIGLYLIIFTAVNAPQFFSWLVFGVVMTGVLSVVYKVLYKMFEEYKN